MTPNQLNSIIKRNRNFNMSEDDKKFKVEFAPGCFDNFEGTQEELNEFIAEITRMAESGELIESAKLTDEEIDALPEDILEWIEDMMGVDPQGIETQRKNKLN